MIEGRNIAIEFVGQTIKSRCRRWRRTSSPAGRCHLSQPHPPCGNPSKGKRDHPYRFRRFERSRREWLRASFPRPGGNVTGINNM